MVNLQEFYPMMNGSFADAQKTEDADAYMRLAAIFSEFEGQLREYIQDSSKDAVGGIIKKLEAGQEISNDETQLIKLWIVGDAEYYATLENNFNDWTQELKRLMDQINLMNNPQPDPVAASNLRAMLRDGMRLLPNIIFFLDQKTRVNNFAVSVATLDTEGKLFLIRLLKNKLTSKEF